jgi:shikimate 5-dehydrogenase
VARAIVYALKQDGAVITVLNRTLERAQEIGDRFEVAVGSLDALESIDADVLVNGTPIGMAGHEVDLPISNEALGAIPVVFETVYRPRETSLALRARRLGCSVVTGGEMFVAQAVRQFAMWFRRPVPKSIKHVWHELVCGSESGWGLM